MAQRQLPVDFKEFLNFLNSNKVKYLLLGGWAVGIYGHPRATKDIDFIVGIDDQNLDRLIRALCEFGAPSVDIANFKEKGNVFRMGRSPVQIDIINEASGINFDESYQRRKIVDVEGVEISLISKDDLIKNKMASGRAQDIADAEKLSR
jgi:hypothetical protein